MTRPVLMQGKAAAKYVGVKPSWFRTLCRIRNIVPVKIGPDNAKIYKKSDLYKLKREARHPGRPRTRRPAKSSKGKK